MYCLCTDQFEPHYITLVIIGLGTVCACKVFGSVSTVLCCLRYIEQLILALVSPLNCPTRSSHHRGYEGDCQIASSTRSTNGHTLANGPSYGNEQCGCVGTVWQVTRAAVANFSIIPHRAIRHPLAFASFPPANYRRLFARLCSVHPPRGPVCCRRCCTRLFI